MLRFVEVSNRFEIAWEAIFDRYVAADYEGANGLVAAARLAFPDCDDWLSYADGCLRAVSGRRDQAIVVLQQALDDGCWWSPRLLADSDLDSLRDLPSFNLIVE